MSNDFTRGPWYRSGCTVYAPNDRNSANRFTAYVQDAHSSREDLLSVAMMMQAAPELLEALETIGVHTITDEDGDDVEVLFGDIDKICAAIAKARGES